MAGAVNIGAVSVSAGGKYQVISPAHALPGSGHPTRAASHTAADAMPSRAGCGLHHLLSARPGGPSLACGGHALSETCRAAIARQDVGRPTAGRAVLAVQWPPRKSRRAVARLAAAPRSVASRAETTGDRSPTRVASCAATSGVFTTDYRRLPIGPVIAARCAAASVPRRPSHRGQ